DRSNHQELENGEVNRDQQAPIGSSHLAFDNQQCQEQSQGHQRCVDQKSQHQAEVFPGNEFPAPHRTVKNGRKSLLIDCVPDYTDADEDGDDHSEQRNRTQSHVDQDQALNVDGNLPEQRRTGYKNQSKDNQVVQNPVAYRFAKRIQCNGGKTGGHAFTTSASVVLARKYSSNVRRRGVTETNLACCCLSLSSTRSSFSVLMVARTVSPVT